MDDKDFIRELFQLKHTLKLIKTDVKAANSICMKKDKISSEDARAVGNKLYGQKNHNREIHNDILLQYTKSIAFAPEDSEELALGFSNRSALLMHLKRYQECLKDIDKALNITKSDQLKSKLESRKEKCLSLTYNKATENGVGEPMKNLKVVDGKTDEQLKLLNMIPSAKIPCVAEFVSIEKNEFYGRQLTANRDIKPGEAVIIEKAYVCYPALAQRYLTCSHCLSFAWNGIPCDSCTFSIYCSETCKEEAWKEYHDIECLILPSIFGVSSFIYADSKISLNKEEKLTRRMILLSRIFIKAVKAEGFESLMDQIELINNGTPDLFSTGAFDHNKFAHIYSLRSAPHNIISHFNACFHEALVMFLMIKYTTLIPVAKKFKNITSTDERVLIRLRDVFAKLYSIIEFNSFSYQWYKCGHQGGLSECGDKCNSFRGAVFAPHSAIINHSCVPNLDRFTLPQPKIIIYASEPIKKGEQLFLSYGPSFQENIAKRKLYLEDLYYTCRCPACTDDQSFQFQNIDVKTCKIKVEKVKSKFEQLFGRGTMISFPPLSDPRKWTVYSEALIKQAFKLIELYLKYLEYKEARHFICLLQFYIRRAFGELYGEKCTMMDQC